jgi:hypothetical protein
MLITGVFMTAPLKTKYLNTAIPGNGLAKSAKTTWIMGLS